MFFFIEMARKNFERESAGWNHIEAKVRGAFCFMHGQYRERSNMMLFKIPKSSLNDLNSQKDQKDLPIHWLVDMDPNRWLIIPTISLGSIIPNNPRFVFRVCFLL